MDAIQKELDALRKKHSGLIRPEDVVEFAKDKKTALHDKFTWDDGTAAHEYRLWQARQVLRMYVTILDDKREAVRMYVSLGSDRTKEGGGYRTLADVLNSADYYAQMLADAKRDFELFRQKYRRLKELKPLFDAFDDLP